MARQSITRPSRRSSLARLLSEIKGRVTAVRGQGTYLGAARTQGDTRPKARKTSTGTAKA
jgi:hypothetical protein